VRGDSIGLRTQIDDIDIKSDEENINELGEYITISGFSISKVKEWHQWKNVIEFLQGHIKVIQLGLKNAYFYDGAIDKRGCSITELQAIMKNAILHFDIDSGLVHLARALGTRSLVLFGATNKGNWGYIENQNIYQKVDCPYQPCFGTEYFKDCPFTDDKSGHCMQSISLEKVLYMKD